MQQRDAVAIVVDPLRNGRLHGPAHRRVRDWQGKGRRGGGTIPAVARRDEQDEEQSEGTEDGLLYCHNIVAGNEKPRASSHVPDCLAWYGEEIRRPL
jgi:hypothetical protein